MLICGDTLSELKKLEDNSIDMGVTSPPYNKQENKKGWLVKNVLYDNTCDKLSEGEYQANQIAVLNEMYRITKEGGSFFYNHKIRWERGKLLHPLQWILQTKWNLRQEIIWDRGIAGNIRGWRFWQVEERIYWLQKPKGKNLIGEELQSRHALLSSIWRIRPENNNAHPAPFPLALPLRCIFSILNEQVGIVIDPYCGSGTTGIAAKILNCDFIGIDNSKQYLSLAENRITNYQQFLKEAQLELNLHEVKETFKQKKAKGKTKNRFISQNQNLLNL
ncbi:site-specific DNA-methyltransferase [Helicobacter sp. MIT 21-1697]|uniref:DNA-methyltransferase n=1 Tax=Helicobacter sp. MIT 21-1697 TaxID=2993733 RepID=UPI00224AF881|nr:site-specific DNA-methyltransferase [Helicobacter sp. MIT 21-1697]MCX2717446.1 site-specific DNA-methyltransferase [Helicobacter sp. MIT 21-1697]